MPPKAAIHLSNNYKVATQKERAGDASGAFLRTDGEAYSLGSQKRSYAICPAWTKIRIRE